jgi:hypothetical protein
MAVIVTFDVFSALTDAIGGTGLVDVWLGTVRHLGCSE